MGPSNDHNDDDEDDDEEEKDGDQQAAENTSAGKQNKRQALQKKIHLFSRQMSPDLLLQLKLSPGQNVFISLTGIFPPGSNFCDCF